MNLKIYTDNLFELYCRDYDQSSLHHLREKKVKREKNDDKHWEGHSSKRSRSRSKSNETCEYKRYSRSRSKEDAWSDESKQRHYIKKEKNVESDRSSDCSHHFKPHKKKKRKKEKKCFIKEEQSSDASSESIDIECVIKSLHKELTAKKNGVIVNQVLKIKL